MSDRSIDDLLSRLSEQVAPDPDLDARLRQHLAAELRAARSLGSGIDAGTAGSGMTEAIDLEAAPTTAPKGLEAGWLRAAAVVLVVAVGAAVALVATRDDGGSTSGVAPAATFVGASTEPIDLSGIGATDPYFVGAAGETWILSLTGELVRIGSDGVPEVVTQVPEASPLAVDDDAVWIADAEGGRVLRLDPADGSIVAEIETGVEIMPPAFRIPMPEGAAREWANIGGIASNGASVWVGDKAGRVLRIDPTSNEIVDAFDVPVRPDHLQVAADDLLVSNLTGGEVVVVDGSNGDVVHEVESLDELAGAALLGGSLYVQDASNGVVTRIDMASGTEHASVALGPSVALTGQPVLPTGLVATVNGVLVDTDTDPDSLHVLDPETLREVGTLAITPDHGEMTVAPDGSVWLVRGNAQTVVHITPRPL